MPKGHLAWMQVVLREMGLSYVTPERPRDGLLSEIVVELPLWIVHRMDETRIGHVLFPEGTLEISEFIRLKGCSLGIDDFISCLL